jgi:hypothetical protein
MYGLAGAHGAPYTPNPHEDVAKKAMSPLVVARLVGADLSANFAANRNAAQSLPQEQNCAINT